jgi:hypothetical protein
MLRLAVLIVALISVAEGAALLRFINTVPTRLNMAATEEATRTYRVTAPEGQMDRIGIQYFPANTGTTTVQSPTILWTQTMNDRSEQVADSSYSPYAWAHAMPPLRQYHQITTFTPGVEDIPAVDRVAVYQASQLTTPRVDATTDQSNDDNYDQTFLKEDGVGLYLSIAAGTYQMQAYAAVDPNTGSTTPYKDSQKVQARALTGSLNTFTFADNSVYTLVATGNGAFGTATTGNTVALVLFQESVDATTFGMASLRWFHGIKTLASSTIDIYTGQTTSTANQLVKGVAFGGLTQYFDIAPNTNLQTVITVGGSNSVIAAPSTASRLEVTADVRAGLRATVICAVNNDQTERVFCRMIPSRVVAYVRMVNDLAGQESLEQGLLGPTMLKDNPLSLWASYEFPRPDQVVPMSQNYGLRYQTNHPALNRGLYPVLTNVVSGGCTGYGEVFVPVQIMDYATRFSIIRNNKEVANTATDAGRWYGVYTSVTGTNQANPTGEGGSVNPNQQWFWGAATYKRINLVVKTSGFSTLIGTANLGINRYYGVNGNTLDASWGVNPVTLDNYMEPGQYYTLIATSATPTPTFVAPKFPVSSTVSFFFRLDRTIDQVSAGVPAGKAVVNWIPFNNQDFTSARGTINFRPKSGNVNLTPNIRATNLYANAASSTAAGAAPVWNTPLAALFADPGDYIFDYAAVAGADACQQKIPGTNAVTISAGNITDIFLLNSFGCELKNKDANSLSVSSCTTLSARATGNAQGTLLMMNSGNGNANQVFFAGASTISASVLSILISTLLVLLATL